MIPKYRVLMITSEWPSDEKPQAVPFIVRQVNFLRSAGLLIDVFYFRGNKQIKNYIGNWIKVRQILKKGEYDLIHAQWGQSAILALPKSKPLVITFRGDDVKGIIGPDGKNTFKGYILKKISRLVAFQADEVITVSEELKKSLKLKDCKIIPSGLDLNLFIPIPISNAREYLGLSMEKKYILFAGDARNPRKRFSLVQEIVKLVQKVIPNVELLVADGIPHEDVPLYMNASNVLVLVSSHEGSANVIKEALACNLPVVATDVGDARQRIEKIPGCAVCYDISPESIAENVISILERDQRIEGRSSILQLDENILTSQVVDVYSLVMNKQNRK